MPFQKRRDCQIFVPRSPGPLPCVVFLHGVGQNGTDGESHLAAGLPAYIQKHADAFPAVGVFPQCRGPWKYVGEDERLVLDALAAARRELDVDPDRIYLTGLSQGGCSTFDLGAKFPELWAALVVVCGAGRTEDAPKLAKLPIWIFHGEKDPDIPPSGRHKFDSESLGGRDMAKLLPRARYTEYSGEGHAIWDRAYSDPSLWEWLFQQRRSKIQKA